MAEEEVEFVAPATAMPIMRPAAPKAKMTIYYALMIVAFICMLIACLFLYLEIRRFGGFGAVQGTVSLIEQSRPLYSHRGHRIHRGKPMQNYSVTSVPSVANS